MDSVAGAALASWRIDGALVCSLVAAGWIYFRGWRRLGSRYTPGRLAAFLSGLATLFLALDSPLDAFGNLLLEVHMIQHMLLIFVAPPLLLYGQPVSAILRGLPHGVLKHGLGPFLRWRALRRLGRFLVHPVTAWFAMAAAMVVWHLPVLYELGLRSQSWHEVEHACFFFGAILFWWPVMEVRSSHARPRWAMIPYLIAADLVNTALSAVLTLSGTVLYPSYANGPRLGGISALDDQAVAGAIMWVPGSIVFLVPAIVLTMQFVAGGRARPRPGTAKKVPVRRAGFDLLRVPVVGRLLQFRYLRPALQALMLLLAVAIMADGWFGPQVAGLNLAGVLPWIHWRGLAVIALLAAGNLFCMVCPFTLPRALARKFLPARHRWPLWLRSKWLAAGLIVAFLWAYEVFGLWDSPWWTAWIVAAYFAAAFAVDSWFQGASFCKYVCPIGQFHFVQSLVSPLEVKVRQPAVCQSCATHDCLHGNSQQRGCELYLFQPHKAGNFDCTFCLDCVRACPQDNVGILPVVPASSLVRDERLQKRPDVVAMALVLVFGAFLSAAVMTDPLMHWMHRATTLVYIAGLIALPAALVFLCGRPAPNLAGRFALALVPLGLGMWLAHLSFHFFTGWRAVFPVLSRILDPSSPVTAPLAATVSWLPSFEILALDYGLLLTLWVSWRIASHHRTKVRSALAIAAPWAALAVALYCAGVWTMFQPMQMRGMGM